MTARGPVAFTVVLALAIAAGAPASAGPLRGAVRLVLRCIEARQAIDRARDLHERWRATRGSTGTWRSVVARGSSTAPPAAAPRPE